MKYMLVFASEDSWDTVDTVLVETSDGALIAHHIKDILIKQGIEEDTINNIIAERRYYIHEVENDDIAYTIDNRAFHDAVISFYYDSYFKDMMQHNYSDEEITKATTKADLDDCLEKAKKVLYKHFGISEGEEC